MDIELRKVTLFHAAHELSERAGDRSLREVYGNAAEYSRAIGDLASIIRERGRCTECSWTPVVPGRAPYADRGYGG